MPLMGKWSGLFSYSNGIQYPMTPHVNQSLLFFFLDFFPACSHHIPISSVSRKMRCECAFKCDREGIYGARGARGVRECGVICGERVDSSHRIKIRLALPQPGASKLEADTSGRYNRTALFNESGKFLRFQPPASSKSK